MEAIPFFDMCVCMSEMVEWGKFVWSVFGRRGKEWIREGNVTNVQELHLK